MRNLKKLIDRRKLDFARNIALVDEKDIPDGVSIREFLEHIEDYNVPVVLVNRRSTAEMLRRQHKAYFKD